MRVAPPILAALRRFNHRVFAALSFVVPKDSRLLLFGGPWNGNSKAVYEYCRRERPRYALRWIGPCAHRDRVPELESVYVDRLSWRALWLTLRTRWIFINHQASELSEYPLRGRFPIVQLWHGSPIKKILFDSQEYYDNRTPAELDMLRAEFRTYRLVVATSDAMAKVMTSAFREVDPTRVKVLGLPRNDALFDAPSPRPAQLQGFDRVVLYAPTFRDSGRKPDFLFDAGQRARLASALEQQKTLLLLKPHRMERDLYRALASDSRFLQQFDRADFDVVELFPHVDVLVTDYSSVASDFGLTGKPMIFFAWDLEEYLRESREVYFDYPTLVPGPIVRDLDAFLDVLPQIERIHADPAYQQRYAEFVRFFHAHRDGNSTRRVLEELRIV
jgi:CDP-glycerol glycerophosphotransferase